MTYSCVSCVSIWFEKSFCWWVVVPHISGCCWSAAGSGEVSGCLSAASPCCTGGAGAGGKRWAWGNYHEDPGKWEAGGAKGGCRGFWQEPFCWDAAVNKHVCGMVQPLSAFVLSSPHPPMPAAWGWGCLSAALQGAGPTALSLPHTVPMLCHL